uniref:Secreted peptide n=1 Tax=Panagrellus redivivus TaxID=6233 RepID=A0A7E4UVM5_PANRE
MRKLRALLMALFRLLIGIPRDNESTTAQKIDILRLIGSDTTGIGSESIAFVIRRTDASTKNTFAHRNRIRVSFFP